MARNSTEPRACPYCLSMHTGNALVMHLRDAHGAAMVLKRVNNHGRLELWPPPAVRP